MLYCYHCGYELNEEKLEQKKSTRQEFKDQASVSAEIQYVCPRCGRLIHFGHNEEEKKSLSRACHAELQRGRNDFAKGMSNVAIAVILGATGFLFFLLSKKADIQFRVSTTCPEFYIFIVLSVIAVILLAVGGFFVTRGLLRKRKYTSLLKDINMETFVQ
jgi:phage FluMu protein Com